MKPLKYITEPGSLAYYPSDLVEQVINYFENDVKGAIRNIMNSKSPEHAEFNEFLDRISRSRRAEAPKEYNPKYDRFCNHATYILEKTNMLEDAKQKFSGIDLDTIICIVAAHIRKRLK